MEKRYEVLVMIYIVLAWIFVIISALLTFFNYRNISNRLFVSLIIISVLFSALLFIMAKKIRKYNFYFNAFCMIAVTLYQIEGFWLIHNTTISYKTECIIRILLNPFVLFLIIESIISYRRRKKARKAEQEQEKDCIEEKAEK